MKYVELNDETRIPLGWIIGLLASTLPVIVGGVVWFTTLYAQVSEAQAHLEDQEVRLSEQMRLLQSIDKKLSRIEGRLGIDNQ